MSEIIVVHGSPGSGKSSQSERLVKSGVDGLSVTHVSAGNRLRAVRAGQIESNFSTFINAPDAPRPLPDDVVNGLMFEPLMHGDAQPADLILLDGYPRKPQTVPLFLETVRAQGHDLRGVIHLELSQEVSFLRLMARGVRHGEKIDSDSFHDFAKQRYEQDVFTTHRAVALLGESAVVRTINAEGTKDGVATMFGAVVRELLAR